jgi:transposase-like protein
MREIGENPTQKYWGCYMPYHTSTQAPNVSSILVVSGCLMITVNIIQCWSTYFGASHSVQLAGKYKGTLMVTDGTFLTGKYKGTLMIVIGITTKNHLLLLAFAMVEGENNKSWSWFLRLVRKEVFGPGRSICMISDYHHGLLNGAKEPLEEYPPLIHRWCSCHFAANIWKKQRSKEVIIRLKALCKVKEEKKFEARLKELEKILNDDANAWLFEQLTEKSKWALTFNKGSSR